MDLHFQMLAEARQAEIARGLERRTLAAGLRACRRRLLGIFPVGAPCPPAASAC